jgi:hypothetical protein
MNLLKRNRNPRRWFKKKRWWILLFVVGLNVYQNYAPDNAALQDQINSLIDLIPGLSD